MITTLALHPAAAKLIIGQAVAALPEVQQAFKQGKIIISAGTTNVMVAKALLHVQVKNLEPYAAGIITREPPALLNPGKGSARCAWIAAPRWQPTGLIS